MLGMGLPFTSKYSPCAPSGILITLGLEFEELFVSLFLGSEFVELFEDSEFVELLELLDTGGVVVSMGFEVS